MMQRPPASSTPDARSARITPLYVAACGGQAGAWDERAHELVSDSVPLLDGALEAVLPSTRSAIRSILSRVLMHRRLWLSDPEQNLVAHASATARTTNADSWVIFCDFDGTFSVQDVGSSLARDRLPERRAALWQRYEAGEFDAWEYYEKLFDGFECSSTEVDRFLESIDLDSGAPALVGWCAKREIPFRILSDGFDYNLERLQAMHGIEFEFDSNHLEFEGSRWRIAPGGRNPDCGCGTGCCKRAKIAAWRAANPGAFCVHVGNGRVSDLCGALAADLVFAKDSLASALAERGVHHHRFDTLSDVVTELERRFVPS